MNKIFIEAQKKDTSECNFLKTILNKYFPDKAAEFVCMDGVGNLFNESNLNQILQAIEDGDGVIVLLDADTKAKGYGFAARKKEVDDKMTAIGICFPLFLYPNNEDDGDIETLMEQLARKDIHQIWWDCFEDYEKCIGSAKDENGDTYYNLPNRKAKLHTYINSQQLKSKERSKLGSGNWLFDNNNYWDISRQEIQPLIEFLGTNLK